MGLLLLTHLKTESLLYNLMYKPSLWNMTEMSGVSPKMCEEVLYWESQLFLNPKYDYFSLWTHQEGPWNINFNHFKGVSITHKDTALWGLCVSHVQLQNLNFIFKME